MLQLSSLLSKAAFIAFSSVKKLLKFHFFIILNDFIVIFKVTKYKPWEATFQFILCSSCASELKLKMVWLLLQVTIIMVSKVLPHTTGPHSWASMVPNTDHDLWWVSLSNYEMLDHFCHFPCP